MRPLLRVALLRVLLGAVPPAPVPVVRATADHAAAVLGPVAAAPAVAATTPLVAPTTPPVPHPEPPPPSVPAQAPIIASPSSQGLNMRSLPLAFHANTGQIDRLVRFQARGMRGTLAFRSDELIFTLPTPVQADDDATRDSQPGAGQNNHRVPGSKHNAPPTIVHMRFQGANTQPDITMADPLPGIVAQFVKTLFRPYFRACTTAKD